jgi:hypothetical protein
MPGPYDLKFSRQNWAAASSNSYEVGNMNAQYIRNLKMSFWSITGDPGGFHLEPP